MNSETLTRLIAGLTQALEAALELEEEGASASNSDHDPHLPVDPVEAIINDLRQACADHSFPVTADGWLRSDRLAVLIDRKPKTLRNSDRIPHRRRGRWAEYNLHDVARYVLEESDTDVPSRPCHEG